MDESTIRISEATSFHEHSRRAPLLFTLLECHRPLAGGARHTLEGTREVVIGRGQARERERENGRLTLRFPDPLMSRTHTRIVREGSSFVIEDAGSTNGTFVDGERVTRRVLADGALVDVGGTLLTFRDSLRVGAATPEDEESSSFAGRTLGTSTLIPEYADALFKLAKIAMSPVSVLLLGETGTGKEVLARGIHAISQRKGELVAVNCGAIPETLIASQLFGHAKGAFSGAARDEIGYVRASDGGTLLLDEIGDLPRDSQAALLRVLQEREVTPVGSTRAVSVSLRVVAATHQPIAELAQSAAFRSDLYARLAGYTHHLAPLRARREDLGLLLAELLPRAAASMHVRAEDLKLDRPLARALFHYDWPRNVRELQHELSAALVFASEGALSLAHVGEALRKSSASEPTAMRTRSDRPPADPASGRADGESGATREKLLAAMSEHGGNVSAVARAMGCSRIQVHRWMRKFGVDATSFRAPGTG